jgi:hypothetical protein
LNLTPPRDIRHLREPAEQGFEGHQALAKKGGARAEPTSGLRGGMATTAADEGWERILEFLPDLSGIREALLHQKGREEPWRSGSPKGARSVAVEHGATVLWCSASEAVRLASYSESRRCSWTCWIGQRGQG